MNVIEPPCFLMTARRSQFRWQ